MHATQHTCAQTCATCGRERWYYIPRSLGECLDCAEQSGGLA